MTVILLAAFCECQYFQFLIFSPQTVSTFLVHVQINSFKLPVPFSTWNRINTNGYSQFLELQMNLIPNPWYWIPKSGYPGVRPMFRIAKVQLEKCNQSLVALGLQMLNCDLGCAPQSECRYCNWYWNERHNWPSLKRRDNRIFELWTLTIPLNASNHIPLEISGVNIARICTIVGTAQPIIPIYLSGDILLRLSTGKYV